MSGKMARVRERLGAIWEAFNRGEDVPRVWVAGADDTSRMPHETNDWVYERWARKHPLKYEDWP